MACTRTVPDNDRLLTRCKKAALALPIHSLSLSFLPYNSPTQNRFCTQYASVRLRDYLNTTNYFSPSSPPRNQSKCPRLLLRGKKDPNAPKRGLSAYMFFANEQRENVREENPGISFGQVGKLLGEQWKALNEKQRAPYEAKAAADKKRYEDEKQAYNADQEEEESS
ncbi:hypothetical protein H9Q73_003330 [Fusarium xylarioides]|nr:hypothetical protein H9Q73_003330 [Fusarium xylarioides]